MPEDGVLPLLVEVNDKTYLILFDPIDRLTDWANDQAKYLAVTGHDIAELSSGKICWILNYGTDLQKFLLSHLIHFCECIKDIVRKTKQKSQNQAVADPEEKGSGE